MKKTTYINSQKFRSSIHAGFVALSLAIIPWGNLGFAQENVEMEVDLANMEESPQAHFGAPEELVNHLVIAVARADKEALEILFGDKWTDLIPSDGLDPEAADKFLSAWAMSNTLIPEDQTTRTLAVGANGWTFPVPIVLTEEGWGFDTDAGIDEVRSRQIGRNELSVMQALLAYRDAQFEYSSMDRDGDGVVEYAQKVLSSPGAKDGLYWETEEGSDDLSPLGPLFAEGGPDEGTYLGYRYRILTSQGESADGGAQDYVVDGNMTGGFALIAWPAEYDVTGVKSFIINQEGTIYESDLGPDGEAIAGEIGGFNPDESWSPVPVAFTDIDAL
ncbi:MAG: DUF2950 domain-containing protein [Candidatus Omnitrophica bacterium]|nr:DUF2950 domain-containing protein [Candidatus Omnitrophota bacterium]